VRILGKTCCYCKTKENQQQREKQITKIHKETRVRSMEERWLWEEGICSKGNVQFEIEMGYR